MWKGLISEEHLLSEGVSPRSVVDYEVFLISK